MRRLLMLFLLAACARAHPATTVPVTFSVGGRSVVITAEVADTDAEQAHGLMGRRSVPAGTGMLFVWKDVAPRSFYMFRTLVRLDVIAIRDRRVVGVHTMAPCPAEQPSGCPTTAIGMADAALEVASGQAARLGIAVGAPVQASSLR